MIELKDPKTPGVFLTEKTRLVLFSNEGSVDPEGFVGWRWIVDPGEPNKSPVEPEEPGK